MADAIQEEIKTKRYGRKKFFLHAIFVLVALVPLLYLATIWQDLPAQVPIHFNIDWSLIATQISPHCGR
jgi:hypothetical protein